ncbi:MAG: PfkB family carbohydrate kinase [Anaeromyxobacter sp.]
MSPRVLTVGHVTLDATPAGPAPGGSVYYGGQALRALGARVQVLTAAAADFPASALDGLEARVLPAPATTRFENRHGPDGARTQRVGSAAPPLEAAALPAAWRGPDALLLAPVLAELDVPAFLAAAGAPLAGLGVQGLLRVVAADGRVLQPPWNPPAGWLDGVDVVFVGEDEVRGQPGLLELLQRAVPRVVFTHGARGCELLEGGRSRWVGAYATAEVDPTGAGDVFAAGFMLALAGGAEPVEAARLGAAAASIVVEAPGGAALGRVGEAWARVAGVRAP